MQPQDTTQLPLPLDSEDWRPVVGWEGFYEVSNMGQVKNARTDYILHPGLHQAGYPVITLCRDGKSKTFFIHRLVAEVFCGPRPANHQVNHKNGDKADYRAANLEWVTSSQNRVHAYATGLSHSHVGDRSPRPCVQGARNGHAKLTEADVLAIRAARGLRTQVALARQYGVTRPAIAGILSRKNWKHLP